MTFAERAKMEQRDARRLWHSGGEKTETNRNGRKGQPCYFRGKHYASQAEACRDTGLSSAAVSVALKKQRMELANG